jgi:hypothetical protein
MGREGQKRPGTRMTRGVALISFLNFRQNFNCMRIGLCDDLHIFAMEALGSNG